MYRKPKIVVCIYYKDVCGRPDALVGDSARKRPLATHGVGARQQN